MDEVLYQQLLELLHDYNYVLTYNSTSKKYIMATDKWRAESPVLTVAVEAAYKYSVVDATLPPKHLAC